MLEQARSGGRRSRGARPSRSTILALPTSPPPPLDPLTSASAARRRSTLLGLTVFSCEPDEAALFGDLASGLGLRLATTALPVSEASAAIAAGNPCVSVGHKSRVSGATLRALSDAGVAYVSSRSRGLDHVDLAAAEKLGITVENVWYAPDGVADYTVMLILMAIRHAKAIAAAAQRFDFRLGAVRGRELRDLTVGVVGAGQIGRAVIERLRGFGCRILAHDRSAALRSDVAAVPLPALLRESDMVTLHLPLTADTFHLIGPSELESMKPGAVLVNTGRGGLVDTAALVAALETGRLGSVALDVLEGEEGLFYSDHRGRSLDHPFLGRLLALPNAIVMPHTAFYTEGVLHDTVESTLRGCLEFARSRRDA